MCAVRGGMGAEEGSQSFHTHTHTLGSVISNHILDNSLQGKVSRDLLGECHGRYSVMQNEIVSASG